MSRDKRAPGIGTAFRNFDYEKELDRLKRSGGGGTGGGTGPAGPAGPAGTPGSKWYGGAGAPAGGTGVVGDWYINTSNGDYYEKTGTVVWTLRGNLTGVQGPPGPTIDATTTTKGVVQLAGDLAGTAASPQIAAGVITDAEVAAANKDGFANVPSLRTIGSNGQQAMDGATKLNQIPLATATLNLNSNKIVNLLDPANPLDAANKNYVDTVAQGLDAKASVRAATTAAITLSGTQTVDGIALAVNDRVLVKSQAPASGNGIYVVQSGAWTRSTDADTWNELVSAFVFVEDGTIHKDTGWVCTANPGGTLGTTTNLWTQFSSAGNIVAGQGLAQTGMVFDVQVDNTTTEIMGNQVSLKPDGVTNIEIAPGTIRDTEIAAANIDGANATPSMRRLADAAQAGRALPANRSLNYMIDNGIMPPVSGPLGLSGNLLSGVATPLSGNDAATKAYVDGKTPPDATPTVKGVVQLAGDLAGTAASPQIAAGAVTDAEVAAANKDGAVGTPSMRTLGFGSSQAMRGSTALQTIGVQGSMTLQLGGNRIIAVGDPTGPTDVATKQYVDNFVQGLNAKGAVVATSIGAITLSGAQTVDGVAVATGDRVLAKAQTLSRDNGIYVVDTAGAWTRAPDADTWNELVSAYVWVQRGTLYQDTAWVCTADPGGTLGTTALPWNQFSSAQQFIPGDGLIQSTGNVWNVVGTGGIQANPDSIQIANNGVTNAMLADGAVDLASADVTGALPVAKGGTGGATAQAARIGLQATSMYYALNPSGVVQWVISAAVHGLGAGRGKIVQVVDAVTGAMEIPDIVVAANGDVTIIFSNPIAANAKHVTIIGGL